MIRALWDLAVALFGCAHREMIRERRADGGLDVCCARCGYRTVLLQPVGQPAGKDEAERG